MGEDHAHHQVADLIGFGAGLAQKLAPCGGVKEQIAHGDGRALRRGRFDRTFVHAALVAHLHAKVLPLGAGDQRNAADRRNGGQRLPAETQRADVRQVIGGAYLAGGMALKRQAQIPPFDAGAVVGHAHVRQPAVGNIHRDGGSACVHGVFHHLLDGGGGALHHLACGNLAHHFGRQFYNPCI